MENNTIDVSLGLHDFLECMRQPSASDLVKSIKSFVVSFSNNAPDPDRDSQMVQDFFANMESVFRTHPLWANCSEEELESAGEGLEKYVMTKLYPRVFASRPEDVKADHELSQKMALIQQFIRPENLDIKPTYQNETSWLLAQKELQKINMYKAPRDKLVCILNCCKVINNLLLNASIASNENPPGADEFLPVLIYVTIKANPPQLHSNLLYIQRYRRQSRLVAEAAYFLTNILSAESFISNIDAKAISMDETEFEKNMEFARALLSGLSTDLDSSYRSDPSLTNNSNDQIPNPKKVNDSSTPIKSFETRTGNKDSLYTGDHESSIAKSPSLSDRENRGANLLLKEDMPSQVFREYPYLYANVGDFTFSDVESLLDNYKKIVFRYVCLSKGLGNAAPSLHPSHSKTQLHLEASGEHHDTRAIESADESQKPAGMTHDSNSLSLFSDENAEPKPLEEETIEMKDVTKDETS